MTKRKLLALFPSYHSAYYPHPVGGGEISNRLLLEALVARGWDVSVVTCRTDIQGVSSGVKVYKTKGFKNRFLAIVFRNFFLKKESFFRAKEIDPDVVVCGPTALACARDVGATCSVRIGLIVRAFENFKFLIERDFESRSIKRWVAALFIGNYQVVNKPADFYIYNSEYMRATISPCINGNGYVVYPSVDIPVSKRIVNQISNVHMVGLSREKGCGILLKIADRFPELSFSVYGKWDKSISLNELPGNVSYMGWTDPDGIYGAADIFLVPSQVDEAFGRVAVEALAYGCIVLVSDKGGLPETVDYDDRFIISSEDSDAWCSAIDAAILSSLEFAESERDIRNRTRKYSIDNQVVEFEAALLKETTS
ncbi:glycosyltransferase family 4 protein [Alcanivorax sp. VBW004]|uniref:glycosyltransferase family 4 protein n=1 Tax=Alcanivorax sp. VBW004 TaxID=1287708 RepID=UPI0018AD20DF|nr:glycosyltransferase family 4 protein [Alcanivorax sp. VBW004]